MKKILSIIILSSLILSSCDNFKGEQEVPSFIKFDGFYMVENPDFIFSQSSDLLTCDIRDVWVYIDGNYLGAYPLPCSIPILKEGKHKIDLRPGIIYNGMNNMREEYVFYTSHIDSLDLRPGEEIHIEKQPIMYRTDRCNIAFKETFESYFINFQQANVINEEPKTMTVINNDSVAYGNSCGAIYYEEQGHNRYISIDSIFCNNKQGVILEIDYNSNIPFEVGIYGRSSSAEANKFISAVRLTPPNNGKWQKSYIILTKVWNTLGYPQNFHIYLEAFNPNNTKNSFVHVDNIKVVHYPNYDYK
ncbi:MAG: hypothetical protein IKV46_02810 [Bacteroidales bacterium]|jgi:hypothetical protein|nr:hypothetical protein [Bacteroidales bacterium]